MLRPPIARNLGLRRNQDCTWNVCLFTGLPLRLLRPVRLSRLSLREEIFDLPLITRQIFGIPHGRSRLDILTALVVSLILGRLLHLHVLALQPASLNCLIPRSDALRSHAQSHRFY